MDGGVSAMLVSALAAEAASQAKKGVSTTPQWGYVPSNNKASDSVVQLNNDAVGQNWSDLLQMLQSTGGEVGGAVSGDWSRLMM